MNLSNDQIKFMLELLSTIGTNDTWHTQIADAMGIDSDEFDNNIDEIFNRLFDSEV